LLLESYNDLLRQAKTLNDLNRINIAFGNTMTPQEAVELDQVLCRPGLHLPPLREDRVFSDAELRETARRWIEEVVGHLLMVQKAVAEPFLRRDLRKSITLYTDGQQAEGKTLILAFPGANHRLMMPVSALLQALPANRVDIVLIRDGTRTAYRAGLEGVGDSLERFADALPELLGFASYDRVAGVGVSSGGLPILLVSLRLELAAVLVCGGNSPYDTRWDRPGDQSPAHALKAAAAQGTSTRVTVAYGAQSEVDRINEVDIATCLGIAPYEVTHPTREVKHNVLFPLAEEGKLPAFLAERLGF
jgi:hypothetical protein